ncbi:MAG TPA: 2-phospho-L-lactate guanylyltransferase [Gaiellaceae bacterium]|nr:2-phospho-L-lactate guanylyltransferase [Gaiellaceae bacterium]
MDAHVLVPLKKIDPKSRLAGELPIEERVRLMRRLLAGVVDAVREAGVGRVTVVTGLSLKGYEVWHDRGLPWNDALAAAIDEIVTAPLVAVVSADLPALRAEEVEELLAATPERGIAIARALDGGTNAVAMRPPGLVRTHFGEPGSAAVHAGLGVDHAIVDLPGLAFDVDTPEDLARMQAAAC